MTRPPADDELADRIDAFLDAHAKVVPGWDADLDPPGERFNGPDSAMLWAAARQLRDGMAPEPAWSSWGSGCYRPYADAAARAEHDALVALVAARARTEAPPPYRMP